MSTPPRHVGYIGLGIMGSAMAANLLKAGFQITVWNRNPAKTKPLIDAGATLAVSPADMAARGPQVICINVTDTPDVEAVLFGPEGVIEGCKPGLVVIDHSTINPEATQRFAARLHERRVTLLDAPVSGGDVGARNGTLSIMVGGPPEVFERCLPVLRAVGKNITHVGASGMGQVCKACNQVAVACNLMGVCEAMALAKKSGLDLAKMIEVVSAGAGGSWQLANLGPKIAKGDLAPGFMIDLVLKDLAIIAEAAKRLNVPIHGTTAATEYFRTAASEDRGAGGRRGTQALSRALEQQGKFRFAAPDAQEHA